jgi:hypothetical protein
MTSKLKARIKKLEKRTGHEPGAIPVEVFDRIVAGTMTDRHWRDWGPALDRLVSDMDCEATQPEDHRN